MFKEKDKLEFENQVLRKKVKDHQTDVLRIKKAYMDIITKRTDKIHNIEKKLSLLDEIMSNKDLQLGVLHDGLNQLLIDKRISKKTKNEINKLLEILLV